VFESHIVISIAGQFIATFAGLIYVLKMAERYMKVDVVIDDAAEFVPNLVNTVIFLYGCWINTLNFLVNYQGEPFMKPLGRNSMIAKIIAVNMGAVVAAILELPDMAYYMELIEFPSESFKYELLAVFVSVAVVNYGLEKALNHIKYRR
jgi:cation-transporting ATPase 13A1